MIAGQFEAAQTNPVERTVPSQRATIPRWPDDPMTRWPDLSMTGSPADPISQTLHTTLNAARLQFLEARRQYLEAKRRYSALREFARVHRAIQRRCRRTANESVGLRRTHTPANHSTTDATSSPLNQELALNQQLNDSALRLLGPEGIAILRRVAQGRAASQAGKPGAEDCRPRSNADANADAAAAGRQLPTDAELLSSFAQNVELVSNEDRIAAIRDPRKLTDLHCLSWHLSLRQAAERFRQKQAAEAAAVESCPGPDPVAEAVRKYHRSLRNMTAILRRTRPSSTPPPACPGGGARLSQSAAACPIVEPNVSTPPTVETNSAGGAELCSPARKRWVSENKMQSPGAATQRLTFTSQIPDPYQEIDPIKPGGAGTHAPANLPARAPPRSSCRPATGTTQAVILSQ